MEEVYLSREVSGCKQEVVVVGSSCLDDWKTRAKERHHCLHRRV